MGPICDRTREHLGTSDTPIIHTRRCWLRAAQAMEDAGTSPQGVDLPESYRVRAVGVVHERERPWTEAAVDWIHAQPGAVAPTL